MRTASEETTGICERRESSPASTDLPLAAGPQTTIARGARARQHSRSLEQPQLLRTPQLLDTAGPVVLGCGDQRHLRTDERPMGGVERAQRLAAGVHARVAVRADQLAGGPALPAGLEIHRQERKVACDVAPAQLWVELDPIDDADGGPGQHMLATQVPMTVAGEAVPAPAGETRARARSRRPRRSRQPHRGATRPEDRHAAAPRTFRRHSASTRSASQSATTSAERWKAASRRAAAVTCARVRAPAAIKPANVSSSLKRAHLNDVLHRVGRALRRRCEIRPRS